MLFSISTNKNSYHTIIQEPSFHGILPWCLSSPVSKFLTSQPGSLELASTHYPAGIVVVKKKSFPNQLGGCETEALIGWFGGIDS